VYFLCDTLWPDRGYLRSDDSYVHATTPRSAHALAQVHSTMSFV